MNLSVLRWTAFVFFFVSSLALADGPYCALNVRAEIWKFETPDFYAEMRLFRKRKLQKTILKRIPVNGVEYHPLGILGSGSSRVYLALDPAGVKVSIKVLGSAASPKWANSLYYEMAVTRFYLERGIKVPYIVDFEILPLQNGVSRGYLVKEYREGITLNDLVENPRLMSEKDQYKLEVSRREESTRMEQVHSKFEPWLHENQINLYEHPFSRLATLIKYGDFRAFGYGNWLFDLDYQQWIIFDP